MRVDIQQELARFVVDRGFARFHEPAELARSLMIEAAELNRLYQWGSEWSGRVDEGELADELADIAIYLTYLCMQHGIDIEAAMLAKIEKNKERYPVP